MMGRPAKAASISVFVGVELAADHGHYLAYFPDPSAVPDPVQMFGDTKAKAWSMRREANVCPPMTTSAPLRPA